MSVSVEFLDGIYEVPRELIIGSAFEDYINSDPVTSVPLEFDSSFVLHPFELPVTKLNKFYELVIYLGHEEYIFSTIFIAKIRKWKYLDFSKQTAEVKSSMVNLLNENYDHFKQTTNEVEVKYMEVYRNNFLNGNFAKYSVYYQREYYEIHRSLFVSERNLRMVFYDPKHPASLEIFFDPDDRRLMTNDSWIWETLKSEYPDYPEEERNNFTQLTRDVSDPDIPRGFKDDYIIERKYVIAGKFMLTDDDLTPVYEIFKMLKSGKEGLDNNCITYLIQIILDNLLTIRYFAFTSFTLFTGTLPEYRSPIVKEQEELWKSALSNILNDAEKYLGP